MTSKCLFCDKSAEDKVCEKCNLLVVELFFVGLLFVCVLFALVALFRSLEDPYEWWRYLVVLG